MYAKSKMEQYHYILKVLQIQELEMRTIYVDMEKGMRQSVKDATLELEAKSGKEHAYDKVRTTS